MFKFGITLCVVFIFVYAVDARTKALEASKQRYDFKISALINATARDYNDAKIVTTNIFRNILEKLRDYRLTKPAEIITEFQKKQIEADALISAATTIDPVDCLEFISDLDRTAENATETLKSCVDIQLGEVEAYITKIHNKTSEGLNGLQKYRERADKCHSDNVDARNLVIIKCLGPIKRELSRLSNPGFWEMIRAVKSWSNNFDAIMKSCSSKSLNIFYGSSSTLIDMVKDCIQSKAEITTTSVPTTTGE